MTYENNRYRGVYFTKYRPGDTGSQSSAQFSKQLENGYRINTLYWFKFEPIKWRILEENGDTALLLADSILDYQHYYRICRDRTTESGTIYPNNYKESDIRIWLNDTFYNAAFEENEKKIIQISEVDNSAQSTDSAENGFACENTNDRIFLPGYQEMLNADYGFSADGKEKHRLLQSARYSPDVRLERLYGQVVDAFAR